MLLPPDGCNLLNCLLHIDKNVHTTSNDESIKAELSTPINLSTLTKQKIDIPLILNNTKQTLMGTIHLVIKRCPSNGIFMKQNTFHAIKPMKDIFGKTDNPFLKLSQFIVPITLDCRPANLFSAPPLDLDQSPFSCPKHPITLLFPTIDHSTSTFVFTSVPTILKDPDIHPSSPMMSLTLDSSRSVANQFPVPRETWIMGGNPRGGVVNVPQNLRVVSRKQFDGISDTEENECGIISAHSDNDAINRMKSNELQKTKGLGKKLADGLHLRLMSIPHSIEETNKNSVFNQEWDDLIPTIIPIHYNVIPNDDDSCNVDYIVKK